MMLFKCILVAIFLVIILQCNAYKNYTKLNHRSTQAILRNENDDSDEKHFNDKLNSDKILLSDYNNRDDKKNLNQNSGDSYMPPIGAGEIEFDDVTETNDEDITPYYDDNNDEISTNDCILAQSQFYLSWWVHENGSLRIPTNVRLNQSGILDLSLYFTSESAIYNKVLSFTTTNPGDVIRFMSIASNKLQNIPSSALNLTAHTLQYLSLAENDFNDLFEQYNTTFQEFTAFPLMESLKELDLRSCHIGSIQYDYFSNLPALEKLFLSHNELMQLNYEAFAPMTNLRHLDLSYNYYYKDPLNFLYDGMILDPEIFRNLNQLIFLDLSHTKLSSGSVQAILNLPNITEFISLCYTNIDELIPAMFENKNIKVLDLSGNSELFKNLHPYHLSGLETLEILVYRNASIRDISIFSSFVNLRMLDLRHNEINFLSADNFTTLKNLEIFDVDHNQIYNWNRSIFADNLKLKILNIRSNNITMMVEEMLRDFYHTRFLSIGGNKFICACNLRDFIDRASRNARYHYCTTRRSKRTTDLNEWRLPEYQYNIFLREYHVFLTSYETSYRNIMGLSKVLELIEPFNADEAGFGKISEDDCDQFLNDTGEWQGMNFDFLLLDYNKNDYKCVEHYYDENGSSERILQFYEVESCLSGEFPTPKSTTDDESNEEPTTKHPAETTTPGIPRNLKKFEFMYLYILFGIPFIMMTSLLYWKRADIKYFFAIFKNSIILSLDKEDKKALMMTNRKRKMNTDNFIYDVFVSYSDKDRPWVLDEFIPNIEKRAEINICLHERDFQVGMSILENIINCMDNSRCLLLVVSEAFLKSNWCAFEMHLAQHRLIETRREQLILVLLQDIPKTKRSRTLQFLMRTKTYIMWPQDNKPESYAVFWKRLKKAIILNNWESEKRISKVKPRHSIV